VYHYGRTNNANYKYFTYAYGLIFNMTEVALGNTYMFETVWIAYYSMHIIYILQINSNKSTAVFQLMDKLKNEIRID